MKRPGQPHPSRTPTEPRDKVFKRATVPLYHFSVYLDGLDTLSITADFAVGTTSVEMVFTRPRRGTVEPSVVGPTKVNDLVKEAVAELIEYEPENVVISGLRVPPWFNEAFPRYNVHHNKPLGGNDLLILTLKRNNER